MNLLIIRFTDKKGQTCVIPARDEHTHIAKYRRFE